MEFKIPPNVQNALAPYLAEAVMSFIKEDPQIAGELYAVGGRKNMLEWLTHAASQMEVSQLVTKSRVKPFIQSELDAIEEFGRLMALKYGYINQEEFDSRTWGATFNESDDQFRRRNR